MSKNDAEMGNWMAPPYNGRFRVRSHYVRRGEGVALCQRNVDADWVPMEPGQHGFFALCALCQRHITVIPRFQRGKPSFVDETGIASLVVEVEALRAEGGGDAGAVGASADSDLVSLATTLATFYAAHAETVDRQRDALREIAAWATEAYPVEQFPDQDMPRAASALADAGISIGALHGQWARHLTAGIGEIARKALEGGE